MKSATVIDVAELAGVSKSTVSLVIQGSPLVSSATREKVEKAAKQLGYVYNRAAARLRKTSSDTIGIVVTNVRNHFFAEAVSGIETFFSKGSSAGSKTVFLGQHVEDPEKMIETVTSMLESRVDGLIIVPTLTSSEEFELKKLVGSVPTVYLSRRPSSDAFSYVGTDNFSAGEAAAKHLIYHGLKRLVLMGGNSGSSAFDERKKGILAALREGSHVDVTFEAIEFRPSRSEGFEYTSKLISSGDSLPGLIAYNDQVATGIMSAASESGLSAGLDYSVIGVDNIEEARFTNPPLTTIDTKPTLIGMKAAMELERLIANQSDQNSPRDVVIENQLVIRRTCGCKGGA